MCAVLSLFCYHRIPYKNKLGSDLKAHFISWNIKLKYFGPKKMCLAKCVMDTISKYFASADDSLGFRHVVNSSVSYIDFSTVYYTECVCV